MLKNFTLLPWGTRRLYVQIYATVALALILLAAAGGGIFRLAMDSAPASHALEMASVVMAAALPPRDAAQGVQQAGLAKLAGDLKIELALFDSNLQPIASTNSSLLPPDGTRRGWWRGNLSLRLADDRWLVARMPRQRHPPGFAWLLFLLAGALVVALAAWPLVRRLTRRLERLQRSVEALGAGELSARVAVEGRDEVASLAGSFNRAAARIEDLVASHRMLLANTSHELRTPLTRIRMGIEMLGKAGDDAGKDSQTDRHVATHAKRRAELERDIAEIDSLIDEILLASRLDAAPEPLGRERVDMLALVAEEAARWDGVEAEGDSLTVTGDARLLRRMVRNLFENAHRHGAPPVLATVTREGEGGVTLRVRDSGKGVPTGEHERIFEPFYRVAGAKLANSTAGYVGTGLGLSLVRRIARLHGGEARVEADETPGTCIAVTLRQSGA
ncbi:MAG: ATP-binding protein [Burkholderiales bacterium]